METADFDCVVIGAGIAGASAAAFLSEARRVALVEAEEQAGYHSTGRSAAIWIQNYGPRDVRGLTGLSRAFFETPPVGFADGPLMRQRPVIFLAPAEQEAALESMLAEGIGLKTLPIADLCRAIPALRPDYVKAAAIENDAFDMDAAGVHQGFLRTLRRNDGQLALRHRAGRIEHANGRWKVETTAGAVFRSPLLVNAAGAWGDDVASIAGVPKLGLSPCRRTAAIIDPSPYDVSEWPLLNDVGHTWYARPEARTRLMVSPADETPMDPHDVRPDELDIALGIDRMQQALDIPVRRVEHSWAGLRTFTPDRSLAIGWEPSCEGFFWCVGQGGYGIQTSPAAGRLTRDLVLRRDPGEAEWIAPLVDPARFTR